MDNDRIVPGEKNVTVVVSRNVFPGHEREYDDWVRRLVSAAKEAPGNKGVTMLIPSPGKSGLYHVVLVFTDEKSVHQWETSYVRQKLSHEADAFSRRSRQEATGLETWFSLPDYPVLEAPPRWKMSIVSFIAIYLLTIIIVPIGEHFLGAWPFLVLNIPTCVVLVVLMSYAMMPIFSRYVFRHWLYR